MKVLITGGTGFIGSRLSLRCLERNDQVFVLGQENTEAEKHNRRLIEDKGATFVLGSVTDKNLLDEVSTDIDTVFHLAAAQHEANISDQVFYDVNVNGTRNILEASVASGVKRFVHGSTIGVYGDPQAPVDEDSVCNPVNIYGKTKLEGERLALSFRDKIPLVVIRISETYGPGDRRLLKLFKAIKKRQFFKIGPGKNLHQLIFIDDLIEGMLRSAENEKAAGEVILLVGLKAISTDKMIDTVAKELDVILPRIRAPLFPFTAAAVILEATMRPLGIQPPLHRRRMDFFKKSFSFSTTKAKELLDFTPQHSFRMGVIETARWYQENGLLFVNDSSDEHKMSAKIIVDPDLAAQIEPFDTFWEAPSDIEKGFGKFAKFYERNYFKFIPEDRSTRTLVISCGTGYMVELLNSKGYKDVLGIDSDPDKIAVAEKHGLNCRLANAFPFLRSNKEPFNLVFAEQEINHLTKDEILIFLDLCRHNLTAGGTLCVHSLNGANPITGSEAQAQNFNHYNTFTEYSLRQVFEYAGYTNIRIFSLNLYVFYENPLNYIGMILNGILNTAFRVGFIFYGKKNKYFSKKIGSVAHKTNDL